MYNKKLIQNFEELHEIHSVLNNIREAQAYKGVVKALKEYDGPINSSNDLKDVEGIGKRTLIKVDEIIKTGKLSILEDFKKDKNIMARLELWRILGIGPKMAEKFVNQGITSRKELMEAYQKGKIKLDTRQIIGLKYYNKLNQPIKRAEITKYHKQLETNLKKKYPKIQVIMAGSYRRGKSTSGDIDVIIAIPEIKTMEDIINKRYLFEDIVRLLRRDGLIIDIVTMGENNLMGINQNHRQVDIKLSPINLVPFFLLYFGSGEIFARKIRQRAKEKGYRLSEWGIQNKNTMKFIMNKANTEKNIFNTLGFDYVKPENR